MTAFGQYLLVGYGDTTPEVVGMRLAAELQAANAELATFKLAIEHYHGQMSEVARRLGVEPRELATGHLPMLEVPQEAGRLYCDFLRG